MQHVGTIGDIWRYPVKSTRGERLDACAVTEKGLVGDRGWAVRDETAGEVRGGRHLPRLLYCSSRYDMQPSTEPWPAAVICFPDGSEVASDDPAANGRLSAWMQKPVSVWPIQPPEDTEHYRRLPLTEQGLMQEFGREPGEPLPDLSGMPQILMQNISVPGTYFDVTPVHLLTTASLRHMQQLNPDAQWVVPRFRPNIVVDTGEACGLLESGWVGRVLKLGEVELACFADAPRCAITMRGQGADIPQDGRVLRTIVREANQNLGIYCMVRTPGTISLGDKASLV